MRPERIESASYAELTAYLNGIDDQRKGITPTQKVVKLPFPTHDSLTSLATARDQEITDTRKSRGFLETALNNVANWWNSLFGGSGQVEQVEQAGDDESNTALGQRPDIAHPDAPNRQNAHELRNLIHQMQKQNMEREAMEAEDWRHLQVNEAELAKMTKEMLTLLDDQTKVMTRYQKELAEQRKVLLEQRLAALDRVLKQGNRLGLTRKLDQLTGLFVNSASALEAAKSGKGSFSLYAIAILNIGSLFDSIFCGDRGKEALASALGKTGFSEDQSLRWIEIGLGVANLVGSAYLAHATKGASSFQLLLASVNLATTVATKVVENEERHARVDQFEVDFKLRDNNRSRGKETGHLKQIHQIFSSSVEESRTTMDNFQAAMMDMLRA